MSIDYTDRLIDDYADQLVACAECGEQDDWLEAFAAFHPPEILTRVKENARQKWRAKEMLKNG